MISSRVNARPRKPLGSAGSLPAAFGRCAECIFARGANGDRTERFMTCGKLPQITGWQPLLPRKTDERFASSEPINIKRNLFRLVGSAPSPVRSKGHENHIT